MISILLLRHLVKYLVMGIISTLGLYLHRATEHRITQIYINISSVLIIWP